MFQKAKWEMFDNGIKNKIIPLTKEIEETINKQDLDEKITKFHYEIKEICENCIPKRKIKQRKIHFWTKKLNDMKIKVKKYRR